MPTLKYRVPKYCLHRQSGQARVYISGKSYMLGPHGSDESKARYDDLIARHLDRKRGKDAGLTVAQLCALFVATCQAAVR